MTITFLASCAEWCASRQACGRHTYNEETPRPQSAESLDVLQHQSAWDGHMREIYFGAACICTACHAVSECCQIVMQNARNVINVHVTTIIYLTLGHYTCQCLPLHVTRDSPTWPPGTHGLCIVGSLKLYLDCVGLQPNFIHVIYLGDSHRMLMLEVGSSWGACSK